MLSQLPQAVHDPAGPSAQSIHTLGIVMYIGAALVTVLVTVLMLRPFIGKGVKAANHKWFLWGGGVALPLITLTALVPYVFSIGQETRARTPGNALSVEITGHQFWWSVAYRPQGTGNAIMSANELRLPAGQRVELWLRADDVIHSFWVPRLAGKLDMIPGRTNRLVIEADKPGRYRGQCAEYCGMQHALMAFDVIVLPPAEFNAWLQRLAQPARAAASPELEQGRALFTDQGCGACHTIRGVSESAVGPDLTQVGARTMIGAGALPGGIGNIAGWIASAQHIKPGNAMPSFDQLSGVQLRALSAYLESLK